ncbi:MAG: hypothetical protein AAFP07_17250, partial [Cyanobacteria bacterium J06606_4]
DAPTSDDICYSLQQGKFCYVVDAPSSQTLSLSEKTFQEMVRRGYRAVLLPLRSLVPAVQAEAPLSAGTEPTWESSIITAIWEQLHPAKSDFLTQWLSTTEVLSPRQRLMQFASDLLLLDLCEGPIVIIFEGLDKQIEALGVVDALLQWVEHCFELRDTYLTYHHLSFAAFGTGSKVRSGSVCIDRPLEIKRLNILPFRSVRRVEDLDTHAFVEFSGTRLSERRFSENVSSSQNVCFSQSMGYRMIAS